MEHLIYPLKALLESIAWLTAIVLVAWFDYRYKKQQEDQRTDLLMKTLEKSDNPDDVLRNMQKPQKGLRERLVARAGWGWGLTIVGAILVVMPFIYGIVMTKNGSVWDWEDVFDEAGPFSFIGAMPLGIGLGFLISYRVGKKMLKEND